MAPFKLILNFNRIDLDSLIGIQEGEIWPGRRVLIGVFRVRREGNIYIYCGRKGHIQH